MPNTVVRWAETGNRTVPPEVKKDEGHKSGRPEAPEYLNWLAAHAAAGANLDREDCLLHMPLLNGLTMLRGVGTVTFSRDTIGTYIDPYGVLQTAAIDEPRFESQGLLMEGESTNEALQSEDFLTTWTLGGTAGRASNTDVAPDGTMTADDLIANAVDDTVAQAITIPADTLTRTVSVFLKKDTSPGTTVWISIDGVGQSWTYIDWSTYVITGAGMQINEDWWRLTVPITNDGAGTVFRVIIYPAGRTSFLSGSTGTVKAWGAQLEELPFASSYIPTTTIPVTRTVDICTVTADGNVPRQSSPMTILWESSILGIIQLGGTTQQLWRMEGESERWARYNAVTSYPRIRMGGALGIGDSIPASTTTMERLGSSSDGLGAFSFWRDGIEIASTTGQDMSDSLGASLIIGSSSIGGSQSLWGHVSNFRVYDRALSDFEMGVA